MLSQGSAGFVFWGLFFFCDIYESIQVYVNVCVPENRRTFKRSIFFLFNLMTRLYDHDFFSNKKSTNTTHLWDMFLYTSEANKKLSILGEMLPHFACVTIWGFYSPQWNTSHRTVFSLQNPKVVATLTNWGVLR